MVSKSLLDRRFLKSIYFTGADIERIEKYAKNNEVSFSEAVVKLVKKAFGDPDA